MEKWRKDNKVAVHLAGISRVAIVAEDKITERSIYALMIYHVHYGMQSKGFMSAITLKDRDENSDWVFCFGDVFYGTDEIVYELAAQQGREDLGRICAEFEELTKKYDSLPQVTTKDVCISCGNKTDYDPDIHIEGRIGYIEGAGQLCRRCYARIYDGGESLVDSEGK